MSDTTIKVDSAVRDRLALLASENGMTIREFVTHLALTTATQQELQERRAAAEAYVIEHLRPDFDAADAEAGERFWQDLEAQATDKSGHQAA
jgi:hypothetical protein